MASPDMAIYPEFSQVDERYKYTQICPGMFPDVRFNHEHNLQFCMRLLPHQNNDGGFFVALLKKVKPLPWEVENHDPVDILARFGQFLSPKLRKRLKKPSSVEQRTKKVVKKAVPNRPGKVGNFFVNCREHFNFLDEKDMKPILEYFGLDIDDPGLFFAPGKKSIYLANKAVKAIVTQYADEKNLNIFYGGLKLFRPDWRTVTESSHSLTTSGRLYLTGLMSRQVNISVEDMRLLLESTKQSVVIESEISDFGRDNIRKINRVGPVKFNCEHNGTVIEAFGYIGKEKILLENNAEERCHALMMMQHDAI